IGGGLGHEYGAFLGAERTRSGFGLHRVPEGASQLLESLADGFREFVDGFLIFARAANLSAPIELVDALLFVGFAVEWHGLNSAQGFRDIVLREAILIDAKDAALPGGRVELCNPRCHGGKLGLAP